jgi:glycosyltransferase involved in cell wall biosynthesis
MRILYLITRADRGGAQIHVLDLLANLPSEYKPVLGTGEPGFLCEEATKLGVPVRIIPDMVQPIRPLKDVKALAGVVRLIRDESPDVVHAHTSKAGLLARLAAHLTGTPVVFTAHTWSFADGVPRAQRWLSIPLERLTGMLGGTTIAVSQANMDLALRRKILRQENLLRIWNGVADVPLRANAGSRESVTIIMTARFCAQKDHLLLLEALADVKGRWRLVLVGDGPTRPQAERAAARLKLTERVNFIGDRDDIPRLLADADIFVLATRWEGLPLSILEAMRAGLPVIATNVGGVAEAVTDGVNGYLTQPGNVAEMRNRIQGLIWSRELLSSMGYQARCRYEQDFRLDVMMQKTLTVYRKVLTRRRQALRTASVDSLEVLK